MLVYILKSSVCLAILFLFYKLFLEKENMHVFKRFYLLSSVLIAFVIPLITFTKYVASTGDFAIENLTQINTNSVQIQESLPYLSIVLWSLYATGVFFFGIKFIYNLSKIIYNINNNPTYRHKNFVNVLLQNLTIPHTFFNYIFLNKSKFEAQQIPKEVLLHEETHAQQKHSIDIILIEILQIALWFNPLVYFIKHAIKLNHEFLADQAVLNHGINTSIYQKVLLQFSLNNGQPQLANAINYSFIKKRFTIMKTHTSKKGIWLRSIILLPLLATLIYGFSNKIIAQKEPVITNNILIQVTKDKKIVLNREKSVTIETLADEIKKFVKDYDPEQLATIKAIIEADESIEKGFITDISIKAKEAGITSSKLNILKNENQEKATPEEISEYNALAKHYNAQAKDKIVIKLKDVKRLNYIYGLMTAEQKKNAEPFPNFPPPPPPVSSPKVVKNVDLPPPPPIPANATSEQKKKYKKIIENYNNQKSGYVYKHKTKDGEVVDVAVIPDEESLLPPPLPKMTDNNVKTGFINNNGEKYYYSSPKNIKTGKTKYYDKHGNEVNKNGVPIATPTSPKPNMTNKTDNQKVTGVRKVKPQFTFPSDVTYFINGEKASLIQVGELNVDNIIKIDVKKKNTKKGKGKIYITTRQ